MLHFQLYSNSILTSLEWEVSMVVHLNEKSVGYGGAWKIVILLKMFIVGPPCCNCLPFVLLHSSADILASFFYFKVLKGRYRGKANLGELS